MDFHELIYPRVHEEILADVPNPWTYPATRGLIPLLEFSEALQVIEESLTQTVEKKYDVLETANAHEVSFDDLGAEYYSAVCLLYSSVFIHIYGVFESSMLDLCKAKRGKHRLAASDLAGHGIERCKTYLTKVVQVPFDFGKSQEWGRIQNYGHVRNCLVHSAGRIDGMSVEDKLRKFAKSHPQFDAAADELTINEQFCREVIQTCMDFWTDFVRSEANG